MRNRITRLLSAVAVVALMWLIWYMLLPSHPQWIPREPPREEWRVKHPGGCSIVCPPGWSVIMFPNFPNVNQFTDGELGSDLRLRRYLILRGGGNKVPFPPAIYVKDLGESTPESLWAYHESVSFNMRAYEQSLMFTGNKYLCYYFLLTTNGRWYSLEYSKPVDALNPSDTNMPAMILRYLQSFQPIP
jgi:hypothetical protein